MYKIYFRPRAFKTLERLKEKLQLEINSALDDLKLEVFASHNTRKIEGTDNAYRLRVGRWRVLFAIFQKEKRIEIVDIFLRSEKGDYQKRIKLIK